MKKKPENDFVFFKYYTDEGKGDDEESEDPVSDYEENEDCECKDLLLKQIELIMCFELELDYNFSRKWFPMI
jgi:hypothetical protein